MRKVYQAKFAIRLVKTIMVDGKQTFCEFTGGRTHPKLVTGRFSTESQRVQSALERNSDFNKTFYLAETTGAEPSAVEVAPATVVTQKETPNNVPEQPTGERPKMDADEIDEVVNAYQAKMYLNKKHSIPHSRLKNSDDIKAEAKILKIKFKNWK
jgi:hypothetical protein